MKTLFARELKTLLCYHNINCKYIRQSHSESELKSGMLSAVFIPLLVILSLEAGVILLGNAFTIFVFSTQRSRLKRTCFLLINLAVADLLVGVSESIILGTEKITNVKLTRKEEKAAINPSPPILLMGSSMASVLFLALVSVERVYSVLWPFRHRVASIQVYICAATIVWVFGFCTTGLNVLSFYYPSVVNGAFVGIAVHSCLFVALLVICASYVSISNRLRKSTPQIPEMYNGSRRSFERNLHLSRTLFIVVALSLAFWLPAFMVYSTRDFCKTCLSPLVLEIVNVLRLANSVVNPFVYTFRMPIFKGALKQCRKRQRQDFELRPI